MTETERRKLDCFLDAPFGDLGKNLPWIPWPAATGPLRERLDAEPRHLAKMPFVVWADEDGEVEVFGGRGDREVIRGDHASTAAEDRDELGPSLCDRGIEVDDAGCGDQHVDASSPKRSPLPVSGECNADEQLAIDDGREHNGLVRVSAEGALPVGAGPVEGDEGAGIDY